jgi:epoxyqueuosine reductase
MSRLEQSICDAAYQAGFALVGFAPLRRLARQRFYTDWLDQGRAAQMTYLARAPERRFDPRAIDPRLNSVVSLAYPYAVPGGRGDSSSNWRQSLRGRIAAYALGPDYHDYVLGAARKVALQIEFFSPESTARVYVDTGPVFEREWARETGIGWFGKNTNILNRDHGSYFFLAEIFTDLQFEAIPTKYGEFCGTCRRCIDLCPTGALEGGYLLEPRLCISYLTIELRGPIPAQLRPKLSNWIFGCDICQEVCPWNEPGSQTSSETDPYMPELMGLDEAGFRARFGKSALRRAKRRGLLRNTAIALGNSGNREAVPSLIQAFESDREALVRSHCAWALGQIGGATARFALEHRRNREPDGSVRAEIDAALETN